MVDGGDGSFNEWFDLENLLYYIWYIKKIVSFFFCMNLMLGENVFMVLCNMGGVIFMYKLMYVVILSFFVVVDDGSIEIMSRVDIGVGNWDGS